MANRSTFNSVFPRDLKRLWTLERFENKHERGEAKRMWILAHEYARRSKNRKLRRQEITDEEDE